MSGQPPLLADIGGTNARFGLAMPVNNRVEQVTALRCADYPGPIEAAIDYLGKHGMRSDELRHAAFAVATPIHERVVHLTNSNWSIERAQVEQALGLSKLTLLNDFEALAMALPSLTPVDYRVVGSALPQDYVAKAVVGPGTGLGVATTNFHNDQYAATMDAFFSLLGSFADNAALTFGARGGVFIGGGIVPRVFAALEKSQFRARFESKGRFEPYLKQVCTAVITAQYPALFGLANTMAQQHGTGAQTAPP